MAPAERASHFVPDGKRPPDNGVVGLSQDSVAKNGAHAVVDPEARLDPGKEAKKERVVLEQPYRRGEFVTQQSGPEVVRSGGVVVEKTGFVLVQALRQRVARLSSLGGPVFDGRESPSINA